MGSDIEEGRKPLQLPGATEPPPMKSKPAKAPERAPRGDWLLAFFRLINIITICCAALCMVADCMALVAKGKPEVIFAHLGIQAFLTLLQGQFPSSNPHGRCSFCHSACPMGKPIVVLDTSK